MAPSIRFLHYFSAHRPGSQLWPYSWQTSLSVSWHVEVCSGPQEDTHMCSSQPKLGPIHFL